MDYETILRLRTEVLGVSFLHSSSEKIRVIYYTFSLPLLAEVLDEARKRAYELFK